MSNLLTAVGDKIKYQTERQHTLGESFSSFFFESRPSSAFTKESLGASREERFHEAGNQSSELTYTVCETAESLGSALGISAQVSASLFGVKVEGSAEYAANETFSSNSFVAIIRARCVTGSETLDSAVQFTEEAKRLLREPKSFVYTYGDYYCSELTYGGELLIFLSVTASSISQKEKVAAAVKAAWGSGQADADFAREFEKHTESSQKSYRVSVNGMLENPKEERIESLLGYARGFCSSLEQRRNVVRVTYSPFIHLPIGPDRSMEKLGDYLRIPSQNLDDLVDWMTEYRRILYDTENVIQNTSHYGIFDEEARKLKSMHRDILVCCERLRKERKNNAQFPHEIASPAELFQEGEHPDHYRSELEAMALETRLHVRSDQPVYLRDRYSHYVCTIMNDHREHPFPSSTGTKTMLKLNSGGSSYLQSGDTVTIHTTEHGLQGQALGKFSDHHWLYWSEDKGEAGAQEWVIRKVDGDGPIRYGDKVFLENKAPSSRGFRMAVAYKQSDAYLLARERTDTYEWRWWIIEKP